MAKTVFILFKILLIFCVHALAFDEDFHYETDDEILSRVERAVITWRPLKINIVLLEPYTHINESSTERSPTTERYIGYVPDLIAKIAKKLNFSYDLFEPPSRIKRPDMDKYIDTFINSDYDMIAAPITITAERQQKVDFIHPFSPVGLSIVMQDPHIRAREEKKDAKKKGKEKETPYHWDYRFNVLKPFEPETWAVATIMIIVVWFIIWMMNRYNPYEHGWRYDNGLGSEDDSKLFNITGALWFVVSTLQWQGYDRRPRSCANRTMAVFWMCFVLLTLVSYIASSVNHMFWSEAVKRQYHNKMPFEDLRDLLHNDLGYHFGCLKKGTTYEYLTNTDKGGLFEKIKSYLLSDKGDKKLVSTIEDGFKKVRKERYAFIAEEPLVKYQMSKGPCDLVSTDIKLGVGSYGFAVKKGSEFREALDRVTIALAQNDYMETLEDKWFTPNGMCSSFGEYEKHDTRTWHMLNPGRVDMHSFWSVILFIVIGISVSTIVAGIEIFWYRHKGRYRSAYSPSDDVWQDGN